VLFAHTAERSTVHGVQTSPPGVTLARRVTYVPNPESPGVAQRMLFFTIMKYLKKILLVGGLISALGSAVAGCYVEQRGPRYAHRGCAYGYYWDDYRCHHVRRW